jgi:hypothetical protein
LVSLLITDVYNVLLNDSQTQELLDEEYSQLTKDRKLLREFISLQVILLGHFQLT